MGIETTAPGSRAHLNVFSGTRIDNGMEQVYESGLGGKVGVALAIIGSSKPHFHKQMTEYYMVVDGTGTLHLGKEAIPLKQFDCVRIDPNIIHSVVSEKGIRLWVVSDPPWSITDHFEVEARGEDKIG